MGVRGRGRKKKKKKRRRRREGGDRLVCKLLES